MHKIGQPRSKDPSGAFLITHILGIHVQTSRIVTTQIDYEANSKEPRICMGTKALCSLAPAILSANSLSKRSGA